jgi:hypothetical protein
MTVGGGGGGNGLGLDSSSDEYEYAKFAFKWKESQQSRYHARDCLAKQPKVTADMRTKVLEWLVLVNNQFRYSLETWCLAVNLLDRFLRAQPVDPEVLQCAALAAFFVAAKLEEVDPPIISELHNVCEEAYSSAQFRCMEAIMLKKVNFELLAPTPAWFLRKICADRDHGELDSLEAYGFAKRLERCSKWALMMHIQRPRLSFDLSLWFFI